jgi:hypothetical protein
LQDPPKFTQIWIFGLKTNHLATLVVARLCEKNSEACDTNWFCTRAKVHWMNFYKMKNLRFSGSGAK